MACALQDAIQQFGFERPLVELSHHAAPAEHVLKARHYRPRIAVAVLAIAISSRDAAVPA